MRHLVDPGNPESLSFNMPNLVGWTINIDHALIRQKCFDEPHEVKWKPLSRQRNVQIFMKGESLLSDLNYGDDDPEGLNVVLVVPSQEGGVVSQALPQDNA